MTKLLEVENLSKYYTNEKKVFKALNNISFSIERGKTLALVGESGSGKTTAAKTILKLTSHSKGKVLYEKQNILLLSSKQFKLYRKKMQLVFQDPYASLNPRMTIKEIIEEPLKIHRIKNKGYINQLLDLVKMPESSLNKFPHEFSGGQRQRVGIARALSLRPEFLILDEPVSALDVSIQAQIINLLKELQKELKLTYLLIAHDFAVVKYMADDIAVMHKGEIVEQNTATNIFENPKNIYTRKLLEAALNLEILNTNY